MTKIIIEESGDGFNILVDDDCVGYIKFDKRGDGGYIQRVFIDPDHRSNGYAKAAVGRLINQFNGRITSGPTASRAMEAILRSHGFTFHKGEDRPEGCEADLWIYNSGNS